MTYLIDGYNLMYALGLLGPGVPANGLRAARGRFLDWLAEASRRKDEVLRVVFDARQGPFPSNETPYKGLRVQFAFGQTADERIEELVRAAAHPKRLVVISNDTAVRELGQARGGRGHTCEAFVDWLLTERKATRLGPPEADKPTEPAESSEMAAWLAAFEGPKKR